MIVKQIIEANGYEGCVCCTGEDITLDMINQCFKIDNIFFKEQDLFNRDRVTKWLQKYNDMCAVIYQPEENKVIGYCFYIFVTDEALELYKKNIISYFTMGESLFIKPHKNGVGNLFCLSDACLPGWNVVQLHRAMCEVFVYQLHALAKDMNFKVKNVSIDVVCEYDSIIIQQFHMSEQNAHPTLHNSNLYIKPFDPNTIWTKYKYSQALLEEYRK